MSPAQLNVSCSARPFRTPAAPSHQCLPPSTSGLCMWPITAWHCCLPKGNISSSQCPKQSGRWQALSKLLGARVMGQASVSPSGKGKLPLCGLQGLSHVHPPQGLSVLEPGGPGRLETVGMGTGLSRGPTGVTAKSPQQGWAAVSSHTWCPSLHHGAGQEPGVQLLTVICCRCVIVRWLCIF